MWYIYGIKTTIDSAGRIVIPKEIRSEAGLKAGMSLEIHLRDGRIEIEPEILEVDVVRSGRLTIVVPKGEVEPLTKGAVEETREKMRQERRG
ncbi:AbrB/MazE/SpoVT family DNA-binding domain-containing protein [candidate division TA06 bacterium]|nr:AbrB/MazE/SpoVT family DNA-binding domain-containing protein [candidate division TA06 bacterium]